MNTVKLLCKKIRRIRSLEKYKNSYYFAIYFPYNEQYIGKKVNVYLADKKIIVDLKNNPKLFNDAELLGEYTIFKQYVDKWKYAKLRIAYKDELIKKYELKSKYKVDIKLPYIIIYL